MKTKPKAKKTSAKKKPVGQLRTLVYTLALSETLYKSARQGIVAYINATRRVAHIDPIYLPRDTDVESSPNVNSDSMTVIASDLEFVFPDQLLDADNPVEAFTADLRSNLDLAIDIAEDGNTKAIADAEQRFNDKLTEISDKQLRLHTTTLEASEEFARSWKVEAMAHTYSGRVLSASERDLPINQITIPDTVFESTSIIVSSDSKVSKSSKRPVEPLIPPAFKGQ